MAGTGARGWERSPAADHRANFKTRGHQEEAGVCKPARWIAGCVCVKTALCPPKGGTIHLAIGSLFQQRNNFEQSKPWATSAPCPPKGGTIHLAIGSLF